MSRSTFGSIRKRGDNCWELRWTVKGKRYSENVRGTKKQAETRLAEIRLAIKDGRRVCITIDNSLTRYGLQNVRGA